jgi:hypothetical protein
VDAAAATADAPGYRVSVDWYFTPAELFLIAIGAADQTALRLAIRVKAGQNGVCSYD